jgi:hypothetical protein
MKKVLILGAAAASVVAANAALLTVDFVGGAGGPGLEVPAVTAPGATLTVGSGLVYFNDISQGISVNNVLFNNLTGSATAAGLYNAAAGANGPKVADLSISTLVPGSTSGTLNGVISLGTLGYQQLLLGNLYINVLTAQNPTGEVRGQLTLTGGSVPEPAETAAVVGLGLAGFALWRRRQAK